jgi:predicted MFS family arabinose efflux permease
MLVNAVAGFLVPLATGLWSDRTGRRGPFIAGGSLLAAGGLVAVGLGTASSYAVLALAAATVYVGSTPPAPPTGRSSPSASRRTGGRRRRAPRRARCSPARSRGPSPAACSSTPRRPGSSCSGRSRSWSWRCRPSPGSAATRPRPRPQAPAESGASLRLLAEVLRRPGTREVLLAQTLWVGSYAALTPFMVLYSEEVLGLTAASAGALLAVFGVLTGAGWSPAPAWGPTASGARS